MGNMIGSGVFLLPASLAAYRGLSLVGWVISAAGAVCLALVFARLASFRPASGGPYAYTRQAYGDLAGFLVAWGYWISIWTANAALAVAFVGYLDPFIPSVVRNPVSAASLAVGTIWLLTAVNCRGALVAGRVQFVTTTLKILPLLLIGIAGTLAFEPSHFSLTGVQGGIGKGVLATVTLTLFAFVGLECATVPAGSTVDPRRTIPRATVIGTLLAAALYLISTAGVMSLMDPATLAQSTAPFADAARVLAGDGAAALVAIGAAISCFGALNGWVLIGGQVPLAIAPGRTVPGRVRTSVAPGHAGRRDGCLRGAFDRARRDELLARPRRAVHVHPPARHAEHARAVHLLFAGGHHPPPPRAEHELVDWRHDRFRPGVHLLAFRHWWRRPGRRLFGAFSC